MKIKKYKYHKLSLMCFSENGELVFEFWLQKNLITSLQDMQPKINTMLDGHRLVPSLFIFVRTQDVNKWKSSMFTTMLCSLADRVDMLTLAAYKLREYRDLDTLPVVIK